MGDKEKVELWHFEKWRSGNDTIDKAVWEVINSDSHKRQQRAYHRLTEIGEAAVPTLLNALIDGNTTYAGFAFGAGHCLDGNLPLLRALEAIGSPLAFPVLRKLHKYARKEKMNSSGVSEHRVLFSAVEDALHKCDQRWWRKLFRSHQ